MHTEDQGQHGYQDEGDECLHMHIARTFRFGRAQGRMPFANRLGSAQTLHTLHVTRTTLEGFQLLRRDLVLNGPDGIIHLAVDVQEHLKSIFCGPRIFKQRCSTERGIRFSTNNNARSRATGNL